MARYYDYGGWEPYMPVAQRKAKAAREIERLRKKGKQAEPVIIEGSAIAKTFWGKSWCQNLERYGSLASRLTRGRSYVRNGAVMDLQITIGQVDALVSGSRLYTVEVTVDPVPASQWKSIREDCATGIDSLVDLLQGRFSKGVMERICQQKTGLFPSPAEIEFHCSCPDYASMCKHVAAVLYGIGARFDTQPELLFELRGVDGRELIASLDRGLPFSTKAPPAAKLLQGVDLSGIFGLELVEFVPEPAAADHVPPPEPAPLPAPTPVPQPKARPRAPASRPKAAAPPPPPAPQSRSKPPAPAPRPPASTPSAASAAMQAAMAQALGALRALEASLLKPAPQPPSPSSRPTPHPPSKPNPRPNPRK